MKDAITRHVERLEPSVEVMLAACAPAVGRWARDPVAERARSQEVQDRRWRNHARAERESSVEEGDPYDTDAPILGQWFGRTFALQRDVAGLLAAEGGPDQLRRRVPGAWTRELLILFEHPQVGDSAKDLWWELRSDDELLDEVPALHPGHEHLARVLRAASRLGTPSQRREALLRAVLHAGASPPTGRLIVEGVAELASDALLEMWTAAWQFGVLAGEVPRGTGRRADPSALEALYASFLDDEVAPARWRAVAALRALAEPKEARGRYGAKRELALAPGIVSRLRRLLADPEVAVRVEALALLVDGGIVLALDEVVPLLLAGAPTLRTLALRAALMAVPTLSGELVVSVLALDPTKADEPFRYDASPPMPWIQAMLRHHAEALSELHAALQGRLSTWDGAARLLELAKQPGLAPVLEVVLKGHHARDASPSVVRRALRLGSPAAKRWAVKQLGWRSEGIPRELVEPLAADLDQEVAEGARQWLERGDPKAAVRRPGGSFDELAVLASERSEDIENSAPGVLDEEALRLPMSRAERRQGRTVSVAGVKAQTTFADAWRLLGQAALETKSAEDMDGFYTNEGFERITEYAQQAAGENRGAVREVFEHLRGMYTPEWRDALIDDLGHPSRGLLAKLLLSISPGGRELLRAIPAGEVAARRVAELAAGTPLAGAVIDALVEAIANATLPVGDGRTKWGGYGSPEPIQTLRRFGGREGLIRLVVRGGDDAVTAHAVTALLDENWPVNTRVGEGPAAGLRAWVNARLDAAVDRTELLRLLALCTTEIEAGRWRQTVNDGALQAPEVAAVATLVGQAPGADGAAWLQALAMSTSSPAVVNAAFASLAGCGTPELARWMLERLDDPPPAIREATALLKERETRRRAAQEAARAAGDREWYSVAVDPDEPDRHVDLHSWEHSAKLAVVRHGDEELGYRLAWRSTDEAGAIELCEKYGRLPCHALLVLGALANDPGEHAVDTDMCTEVVGSGVPEQVTEVVNLMVKRTNREGVRLALLEARLRGHGDQPRGSLWDLDGIFRGLGGPRPRDKDRLVDAVRGDPGHSVALEYLSQTGGGEPEVLAIWRECGAPWIANSA